MNVLKFVVWGKGLRRVEEIVIGKMAEIRRDL